MSISKVAYERPVSLREIIHAQHGDLPGLGIGQRPHQLDQRVPANAHSSSREAARPAIANAISSEKPRSSIVRTGMPPGEPGVPVSDVPHPARWIPAGQTADRERNQDGGCLRADHAEAGG